MNNYKVVVHRNKIGTKPLKIFKDVAPSQLSQIIYGLITEYPGCSISLYPIQNHILVRDASIKRQLDNFMAS